MVAEQTVYLKGSPTSLLQRSILGPYCNKIIIVLCEGATSDFFLEAYFRTQHPKVVLMFYI